MLYTAYTFYIERLINGSWIVGWREGGDDYGRIPATRAGFATYTEAEKYATTQLRDMMRKQRDELAKADKTATV